MTSHYRHRRFSDPATVFPTLLEPGEIAVNTANRQLAVGDANPGSAGSQIPLLAVRLFDARSQYGAGDHVLQIGALYRAKAAIPPGAFDTSQWDVYVTYADGKTYIDAGDAAITAAYQAADATLQTDVDGKVNRAGDTMTGFLSLYSAPQSDLHAATKKYVDQQVAAGGIVTLPALNITYLPTGSISSTNVQDAITELGAEKAPIYSPDLQGIPTTATPPSPDNSTKITNTAWVQNYTTTFVAGYVGPYFASQASAAQPLMDGAVAVGASLKFAREDHRHPVDTSRAPLASPAFTGIPTAPTPAQSNNSTQIATTAFLAGKFAAYAPILDPVFTGNPQAPTPAPGDSDTSIATTAFVAAAVATAVSGSIAVPVEYALASKTVTIPAGAHSLEVTLQGGGGGGNGNGIAGGAGATLIKLLTGLTPGHTFALTIGAGGFFNPAGTSAPGGATILASGTQAITTLTAGGGAAGTDRFGTPAAGGVASNGDINITGQPAMQNTIDSSATLLARGGSSLYGGGGDASPPTGYGAGGGGSGSSSSGGVPGTSGTAGLAILRWYP